MRRPSLIWIASLSALVGLAALGPAEAARLVSAKGSQQVSPQSSPQAGGQPGAYGRIVLTFDAPVTVKPKLSGSILVLGFGENVAPGPERITSGMPDYVSTVRRDPDGTALRLALQRPYRLNTQVAGEQVFVDLLPEPWAGLPPPLPPEVIAELARRAREAEAALRVKNPVPVPKVLPLELALTPTRTRLSLKLPPEARSLFEEAGPAAKVTLPGAWRIDEQGTRGRLKPETGRYAIENGSEGARLTATPAEGFAVVAERDGDSVAIDFLSAKLPPTVAKPAEALADAHRPDAHGSEPAQADHAEAVSSQPHPDKPAAVAPDGRTPPPTPTRKPELREAAAESPPARRAGSGLVFPFRQAVPAALFERAGIATLVFETAEPVALPSPGETGLVALEPAKRVGGFTVLRFPVPAGRLVDLLPVTEPRGWELTAGESLAPSESLLAQRKAGATGKPGIGVSLPDPGSAVWLELDGERIAVVTSGGRRHAGVAKPQRFVDFELLTSRLGLAVLALADDVAVRPELDGVAVEREGGLALSGISRPPEPPVAAASDLVIEREAWNTARRGDVGAMLRERFAAAAEAERRERGTARVTLAKAMMANGLDVEAFGALGAAGADDPVLEGEPQTLLMRGILVARMGRTAEAEKLLSAEVLARNPEARVWRGYARGASGRWAEADADLRSGGAVLDRYPEEVAAALYAAAAEAAVELTDWDAALNACKHAAPGASPPVRDRLALLRARIDEARGGTAAALDAYGTLADQAERPVAAAASLRFALLALADKKIAIAEAIDRLETLMLTWHGGATEAETLAALGRLYGEAGRWRQVFQTVRRAEQVAPDAASTRALHEGAQALFEDLYLGERSEKIGGVEALALYFDYKDFAPAGRRADEIVRRLADRLVALDLLDSADELLEHQIDHRLTGPARTGVAARLATIRLMAGKPLEALKVLDATHLPELPEDLRRARALLRARALSDLTRTDLALETIEGESGTDAERLRADILWGARRWREAGEAHEAILGQTWRTRKPLDDAARADIVRAAIAYGLAAEPIGLERLKAKFAPAMADSADARTFALLTRGDAARDPAFREIARRATTAETLAAFLTEYRKRYPQISAPERSKGETRLEAQASPPG